MGENSFYKWLVIMLHWLAPGDNFLHSFISHNDNDCITAKLILINNINLNKIKKIKPKKHNFERLFSFGNAFLQGFCFHKRNAHTKRN